MQLPRSGPAVSLVVAGHDAEVAGRVGEDFGSDDPAVAEAGLAGAQSQESCRERGQETSKDALKELKSTADSSTCRLKAMQQSAPATADAGLLKDVCNATSGR